MLKRASKHLTHLLAAIALSALLPVFATPISESSTLNKTVDIRLAMHSGSYGHYNIGEMTDVCSEIFTVDNKDHHRPIIELKIMCLAFAKAGLDINITITTMPTYSRGLRMVELGLVHSVSATAWSSDLDGKDEFYVTDPIIRKGELEKGIFTSSEHPLQGRLASEIDLKKYSSVTIRNWDHDYALLHSLAGEVYTTTEFKSMVKMLIARRADFTIIEFPNNDLLKFTGIDGTSLYPLKGVKVRIYDSRMFVVSKKADNAEQIFEALNRGVKLLRQEGVIREYLIESGVVSARTESWNVLNLQP